MDKLFIVNGKEVKASDFKKEGQKVSFKLGNKDYQFELLNKDKDSLILKGENIFKAHVSSVQASGDQIVMIPGVEVLASLNAKKNKKTSAHLGGLNSPMPGKIFKILKTEGSEVKKGETILILEAMKMEHSIRSDKDGKVKKISYKVGELVQGGVILAEVE